MGLVWFHCPNGGHRSKIEGSRLKQQGVKAGVPDIVICEAKGQYHGLFIELKRISGSKTSTEQKEWITILITKGYMATLAFGADEAIQIVKDYMEL